MMQEELPSHLLRLHFLPPTIKQLFSPYWLSPLDDLFTMQVRRTDNISKDPKGKEAESFDMPSQLCRTWQEVGRKTAEKSRAYVSAKKYAGRLG